MSMNVVQPSQYSLLRRANSHGLSALPDEMLLEIVSHFPPSPVTLGVPPKSQIARRQVLCALAEVCQNLRRVFGPCLWQRVEVYAGLRIGTRVLVGGNSTDKNYFKELLRQLNIVAIQDPYLAHHVRYVSSSKFLIILPLLLGLSTSRSKMSIFVECLLNSATASPSS
jgi:hypothetical protein